MLGHTESCFQKTDTRLNIPLWDKKISLFSRRTDIVFGHIIGYLIVHSQLVIWFANQNSIGSNKPQNLMSHFVEPVGNHGVLNLIAE